MVIINNIKIIILIISKVIIIIIIIKLIIITVMIIIIITYCLNYSSQGETCCLGFFWNKETSACESIFCFYIYNIKKDLIKKCICKIHLIICRQIIMSFVKNVL